MTPRAAHAELDGLLDAGDVRVSDPGATDPPYVFAYSSGPDLTHLARGAFEWRWRIVCVAGRWDARASADELDDLVTRVLGILLDSGNEWMIRDATGATVVALGGGRYLAADVIAARQVTLT